MGFITRNPDKYFMLSRQTLFHMAETKGAVLACVERDGRNFNRYPWGGLVFVPDDCNGREGQQFFSLYLFQHEEKMKTGRVSQEGFRAPIQCR
jgi:hypothetical protein